MKNVRQSTARALCVGMVILWFAPLVHAEPKCRASELPTLGGQATFAHAINRRGLIVGWSETAANQPHAFVLKGRQLRDLGTLPGGTSSQARGLNEVGDIVGAASTETSQLPVLWRDGEIQALRLPEGTTNGVATAINDAGQIVGSADFQRCLFWENADAQPVELVSVFGGGTCEVTALNSRGDAVGYADTDTGQWLGFVWRRGGDLRDLPGSAAFPSTLALDINDDGQVAGYAFHIGFSNSRPTRWSSDGDPALFDIVDARATSIDDRGAMTVFKDTSFLDGVLVLLDERGRTREFGALGGTINHDLHMNDRRQVIWSGFVNQRIRAFTCRI
jgi:probable HAF family extracellular repeat protein